MILFFGDIHGDWKSFLKQLRRKKITNAHIIICGDVGIGFKQNEAKEIKELEFYNTPFSKDGNVIYCIRGNHDNPEYFAPNDLKFSNIKLVSDYTVLNLEGLNILCLGGAISVDRYSRVLDHNMWEGEGFYFDKTKLEALRNIDIVASHTIWDSDKVYDEMEIGFFKSMDENLSHDLEVERELMAKAYKIISKNNNLKTWFHGHFHKSKTRLSDEGLKIVGLDTLEAKEYRTSTIVPKYKGVIIEALEEGFEPTKAHSTDAGADCFAGINWNLEPGEIKLIPLRFKVELPECFEMQIRPKSGLALKHGITILNSPGTIDCGYKGEVGAIIINHGKHHYQICKGQKICQAVISSLVSIPIKFDKISESEDRGGGFGSSGK